MKYLPLHPWPGIMVPGTAYQTVRRFSAEDLPVLRSATTSKETFCPSLRLCIPARSTALMCTKTSLLPSSGWMKPKPFWPLNHFTVPCVIRHFFQLRVWVGRAVAQAGFRVIEIFEEGRQSDA